MKQGIRVYLLILGLLSFTAPKAEALHNTDKPMLWAIEGKKPTWLFGTIHLPDTRLDKLPLSVELALRKSSAVYTEIPMEASYLLLAKQLMRRTDGKTLQQVLPPKLQQRVKQSLSKQGMTSLSSINNMKTWVVATILAPAGKQSGQLLDMRLYARAKREGKEVGGLETLFEQVGYFDQFSEDEQITMLQETLNAQKEKNINEKLMQWYLKGDVNNLLALIQSTAAPNANRGLQQKFVRVLLTQRNILMAERILKLVRENPDKEYFFAVGAAHFAGKSSIQNLIRKKGHTVRRVGVTKGK